MAQKKFWWLSLLLAGLLAMGFLIGCEETDDDDDDDVTTLPVPESFRGTWETVAVQHEGANQIYPTSGLVWMIISSTGTYASLYNDLTEMASGSVSWQDGTTDHIILTDTDNSLELDIEVTNVSGNFATFVLPFQDGSVVQHDPYHMIMDGGRITGLVYDYTTNLPLANATLTLTDQANNTLVGTTTSNTLGLYEFSDVTSLYYTVTVALDGYVGQSDSRLGDEYDPEYVNFALQEGVPSGSGTITGIVNDSQENNALAGVRLESDDGTVAYTDAAGSYTMEVEAGVRTVTLSLAGYYDDSFVQTVEDGNSYTYNRVLTPELGGTDGELRFVLTWGSTPEDLDSYLNTPEINGTEYTIKWNNRGSADSAPYATLDNDETDGYGPETITIFQKFTGTYKYYIYNYSDSPDIAGSGATSRIYDESGLLHTVVVPSSGSGRWWYVCDINGSTGGVTIVNTIVSDQPEFIPVELSAKISE